MYIFPIIGRLGCQIMSMIDLPTVKKITVDKTNDWTNHSKKLPKNENKHIHILKLWIFLIYTLYVRKIGPKWVFKWP